MSSITKVPANIVRAWGIENIEAVEKFAAGMLPKGTDADATAKFVAAATKGLRKSNATGTSRGRLHPAVSGAFAKANKGKRYEEKVAEGKRVTQKFPTIDALGRNRTGTWTGTVAEARALSGQTGNKGRLDRKALVAALSSVEQDVADTFTLAA